MQPEMAKTDSTLALSLCPATYGGARTAADFAVSLADFDLGLILQTPSPGASGYNETARFDACDSGGGSCVEWRIRSTTARPRWRSTRLDAADDVLTGDKCFVNVVFTTGNLSGANTWFSAAYLVASVPERDLGADASRLRGPRLCGLSRRAA